MAARLGIAPGLAGGDEVSLAAADVENGGAAVSRQARAVVEVEVVGKKRSLRRSSLYFKKAWPWCGWSVRSAFERVSTLVQNASIPGDGCDEELLECAFQEQRCTALILARAVVLHVNTKTVSQVREERRLHGRMQCLLMLRVPAIRTSFGSYPILTGHPGARLTWKLKLFWSAPRLFGWIGNAFTFLADHGPARWIPAWTCYPPLAIAFWEGMNSVAPSFSDLRAALVAEGGTD
jgi:hypothetical protein